MTRAPTAVDRPTGVEIPKTSPQPPSLAGPRHTIQSTDSLFLFGAPVGLAAHVRDRERDAQALALEGFNGIAAQHAAHGPLLAGQGLGHHTHLDPKLRQVGPGDRFRLAQKKTVDARIRLEDRKSV